jgi:hypothetical protein
MSTNMLFDARWKLLQLPRLDVWTLMQRWRHDPKTAGHCQRTAKSKNAVQMPESPWVWSGGAARAVGAESRSQNWG